MFGARNLYNELIAERKDQIEIEVKKWIEELHEELSS